jgi:glycosyltransferase involved in cell wall biosynthesis
MSDRMTIAWFTPFHARSAIAEFSQHVTARLAELADVEIWTSDDTRPLPTDLQLVDYRPDSSELEALQDRDAIVYNLGNFLDYHASMQSVSCRYPGVVILHDRVLHHLWSELWLREDPADEPTYVERMRHHYGEDGARVAIQSLRGERPPVWEVDEEVLRYPLYEESIVNALGVVTHSAEHARDVASRWIGPVAELYLPCYANVLARAAAVEPQIGSDRLTLLTVGHLNPNKHVHKIIGLLAENQDLSRKFEYRVAGDVGDFTSYGDSLRRQAAAAPDLRVELLGWLPEEELDREMERADVFVNLRHPNMEGGSASLMRQLAYGRPVLCFDSGFFSELPANAVARVPVGDFGGAAEVLRELGDSPARRAEIGRNARRAAAYYDEQRYVTGLIELLEHSRRAAPALRMLDRVGKELCDMHVDPQLPVFDDIARDFARVLSL